MQMPATNNAKTQRGLSQCMCVCVCVRLLLWFTFFTKGAIADEHLARARLV